MKRKAKTSATKKRYVSRPSQITKKAPTKRLRKRRAKNLRTSKKGFFPNPVKPRVVSVVSYVITARRSKGSPKMTFDGKNFSQRKPVTFAKDELALNKARALVKRYPILRKYRVAIETHARP